MSWIIACVKTTIVAREETCIFYLRNIVHYSYFKFNNKFCIQENVLPMGLPLSPLMVDNFENKIVKDVDKKIIKKWIRYVDDIHI